MYGELRAAGDRVREALSVAVIPSGLLGAKRLVITTFAFLQSEVHIHRRHLQNDPEHQFNFREAHSSIFFPLFQRRLLADS